MARLCLIAVAGLPAPQGSKRAMIHRSTGKPVLIESSKSLPAWRDSVTTAAIIAPGRPLEPWDGPLELDMVFTVARPRGHYGSGRNGHLVRPGAPARPHTKPDLSKLARAVEDSLTVARVWTDDARIVEYRRLAKVYVGEDPDALNTPGVLIRVRPLDGM